MTLDAKQFLSDLAEQRERYEKMMAVTRGQNKVIASSDLDALLRILKQKNDLLQEIDEIEKRTSPMRKAWNEERDKLEAEVVRRVEEAVGKTKIILQELLKLEEEGRAMMEKRKGATGEKIKDLQNRKRVRDAYGKREPGESRFYDENR